MNRGPILLSSASQGAANAVIFRVGPESLTWWSALKSVLSPVFENQSSSLPTDEMSADTPSPKPPLMLEPYATAAVEISPPAGAIDRIAPEP